MLNFIKLFIVACLTCVIVWLPMTTRHAAQTTSLSTSPPGEVDARRLETIEDLSESLANQLLELSVATRDRDGKLIADFFPAELAATPFPSVPNKVKPELKWIGTRSWSVDGETSLTGATGLQTPRARKMTRVDFLHGLTKFLDYFAEIEDVRFKVKEAQFDASAQSVRGASEPTAVAGAGGRARVAFYVIGRNAEGNREWARGAANVAVRYVETKREPRVMEAKASLERTNEAADVGQGRWQFEAWNLVSIDSMVAETDIFSEVAAPAGVAAELPGYGAAGNGGFVWHGAAAADFNRDGFVDLVVTAPDRNYLYLNDGAGKFRDASREAGVEMLASGSGVVALDYDNDGDTDIFMASVGQQILLENRIVPDNRFEFNDVSLEAGVAQDAIGFSAVAGDVNGDGLLDIYVTSYNRYGQVTPDSWFRATNGTPNLLFIQQSDHTFREQAAKWGVNDKRWSYAAAFADVNEDGKLDLYVANDFGEKAMYINHGDKFIDEAKTRGVLDPGNGMGVSFGDYNNDGQLDLHASNMSSTAGNRILARLFPNQTSSDNVLKKLAAGNNLFENQGKGVYKDVTGEVGGFGGGWAWGGGFIDFDNDGWEDIFTPNGFISGKSMKDT
ncbi:MAG: VCBS repeat-containing protein [Pyrinomonadaceae bacterium MAG19_C2-C3]|nr:VCBS repeat-containing protein [Pyrinomonadaceae bacterium MAG19_C2-C3]